MSFDEEMGQIIEGEAKKFISEASDLVYFPGRLVPGLRCGRG